MLYTAKCKKKIDLTSIIFEILLDLKPRENLKLIKLTGLSDLWLRPFTFIEILFFIKWVFQLTLKYTSDLIFVRWKWQFLSEIIEYWKWNFKTHFKENRTILLLSLDNLSTVSQNYLWTDWNTFSSDHSALLWYVLHT